jgi:hypothetical protein
LLPEPVFICAYLWLNSFVAAVPTISATIIHLIIYLILNGHRPGWSYKLESLEATDAKTARWATPRKARWHPSRLRKSKKGNQAMTKSLEVISEAVSDPKHPFRKVDNQPKKPQKHRYERRKVKECLYLGQWVPPEVSVPQQPTV